MNYHRVGPLPITPFGSMLLLKIELKIRKLTVNNKIEIICTCIGTLPLCGLGFSWFSWFSWFFNLSFSVFFIFGCKEFFGWVCPLSKFQNDEIKLLSQVTEICACVLVINSCEIGRDDGKKERNKPIKLLILH